MSAGLDLNDPRWQTLEGGYREPYDPRDALRALEADSSAKEAWAELWDELHHQGDVGEASYAALPHIVRIHAASNKSHRDAYAIVAVIDGSRRNGRNPELPDYLRPSYEAAIQQLAKIGLHEIAGATDPALISSILAVIAIWKGHTALGAFAMNFDEDELQEIFEWWWKR
ncbi:MAG TPA: hypothetical protein VNU97_00970 [Rhizomicrobium sp.]|nr:hypothetical protein [Rhizomicrobium sp.]